MKTEQIKHDKDIISIIEEIVKQNAKILEMNAHLVGCLSIPSFVFNDSGSYPLKDEK